MNLHEVIQKWIYVNGFIHDLVSMLIDITIGKGCYSSKNDVFVILKHVCL